MASSSRAPATAAGATPGLNVRQIGELNCHQGAVLAVRYNVDGNYCMTCGKDRLMKLWNPVSGLLLSTFKGHSFEVADAAASADNSQLVSVGADKVCIIWDVASARVLRKYRGHNGRINAVKLCGDDSVIATASYDKTVKLWDTRAANERDAVQTLDEAKDSVASIDVSDHEVLSSSVDGSLRRYDIRVGRLLVDQVGEPVTSCCFSHDKNCVLASSLDNYIRLFDKDTGNVLAQYTGHDNKEFKVDSCLTFDDAYVVSGSEDGQVVFWELVSSKLLQKRQAHGGAVVSSLCTHPKKPMLLTAAADGKMKLWTTSGSA